MRRATAGALLCVLASLPGARTVTETQAATLTPQLAERMESLSPAESLPVLVFLKDRVDLSQFPRGRASAELMIRALQAKAAQTQPALIRAVRNQGYSGDIQGFWIDNIVALEATPTLVAELAAREDIERIDYDAPGRGPDVERLATSEETQQRAPAWGVEIIRAPEVWDTYGLTGAGIVLGSLDTGFDPSHPALIGKWRAGSNSWIDLIGGAPAPYDDHGHGTHTIGSMVGGDGDGPLTPDIGVAYGARFIAAKVLDSNNSFCCASLVINGAQWMLDPDGNPATPDFPHVINNSWYFFDPNYTAYYGSVAAWRAAGIIPIFCIGNEGPDPATTRSPAHYDNCVGVGGTSSIDGAYFFTSRGPSPSGAVFPDDRRKPDISAPGNLVTSSVPGGGYEDWSGTSMAAPHVAGTIALMLEKASAMMLPAAKSPGTLGHLRGVALTYDEILSILESSAVDLGDTGYDHTYGYGRIDAFAAVSDVPSDVPDGESDPLRRVLVARPNPFGGQVAISWTTPLDSAVDEAAIFDPAGRQVRTLQGTAENPLVWNGRDDRGAQVSPGIYFVRVKTPSGVLTGSVTLVR